jgi:hypothetical protein
LSRGASEESGVEAEGNWEEMKLNSFPFWPPKWGAVRRGETIVDLPATNDDFLANSLLDSIVFPAESDSGITINVIHKDYEYATVTGFLAVPDIDIRQRLYALLYRFKNKQLDEVSSAEFDPNGGLIVYDVEICSPRSKYYQVVKYLRFRDSHQDARLEVVSRKLIREGAYEFCDKCERERLFDLATG